MAYFTLGHRLPAPIRRPLFGDRERHGLAIDEQDEAWIEWQQACVEIYERTQRQSFGRKVSDSGYRVMQAVDLDGKEVLEVGPGDVGHVDRWRGRPERYVLADVRQEMLEKAAAPLRERGLPCETRLLGRDGAALPFEDASFDVVVGFYVLEHLHPLEAHVRELVRVLRPGGKLVGAIPAEGGLAWGLGRYCTTRRWVHRHTSVDYDKIICWEHPNFADGVMGTLDALLVRRFRRFWPWRVPVVDVNFLISFVYEKR